MSEPHFTSASLRFLRELARHNEREWFHANKARYERDVREPFLALIGALQAPLAKVSAHYRADPRPVGGSLFRIHRDTRFAHDKTPYKTWAGARLVHERARERECPVFYIHLQPGQCFVGGGLWHPQPETLKRIRAFIADNPGAWLAATRSPAFKRSYTMGGETLVKLPRGFDPAHAAAEDLKRKDFIASRNHADAAFCAPGLPRRIGLALAGLAPLVEYLCTALDLEF